MMPPPPRPSIQQMLTTVWISKLALNGFDINNPALTQVVIPWRAHMEAHKLKVEVKQRKEQMKAMAAVPAPATGSAPTSTDQKRVEGGGQPQQPTPQPPQPPPQG